MTRAARVTVNSSPTPVSQGAQKMAQTVHRQAGCPYAIFLAGESCGMLHTGRRTQKLRRPENGSPTWIDPV